jgi:hypothetical protein
LRADLAQLGVDASAADEQISAMHVTASAPAT